MGIRDILVLIVLGVICGIAIRSLIKSRKHGGGCSGDCSCCGKCGGHDHTDSDS